MSKHPSTTRHPKWCDRQHCETTNDHVLHAGTPVTLRTTDHQFTLTPTRCDEHAHPDQTGSIEVAVGVVDTTFVDVPDAEITLCGSETKALAEALLIAYLTATPPQLAAG